jgi:ubiquinone/menaquinone biosynthesis C-methylase UbiE
VPDFLAPFRAPPDRARAHASYRRVAAGYDRTCGRIAAIRLRAVAHLGLRGGEHVVDVACGTGPMLPVLARAVGPGGRVTGIEQSPEMASQARARACDAGGSVQVVECAVEEARAIGPPADAVLMCWTHDVLQSPAALDALLALARPGARIAIAGMVTLPWWWGWPVNALNLLRARPYMTTFANLDAPWRGLVERGAELRVVERTLWGTAYVAHGTLPRRAAQAAAGPRTPRASRAAA